MATYPTHGVHLRQRHPNRWLLVAIAVIAALVGVGVWALLDHYTGGTTKTAPPPATLASSSVANRYIAALDKLDPAALQPILAKNVVEVDKGFGSAWHSAATLVTNWADTVRQSGHGGFRGNLCCATSGWAAVTYRFWGSTNPLTHKPFKTNGLSVLKIENGKVVSETLYWDVPGRNPGIAGTVGRKFATALAAGMTPRSLYSKDVIESYVGMAPPTPDFNSLIWNRWGTPSFTPLHASLCCAAPGIRLDNGTTTPAWAVVDWVAQNGGTRVSGLSILQLDRHGKIVRETMYY